MRAWARQGARGWRGARSGPRHPGSDLRGARPLPPPSPPASDTLLAHTLPKGGRRGESADPWGPGRLSAWGQGGADRSLLPTGPPRRCRISAPGHGPGPAGGRALVHIEG